MRCARGISDTGGQKHCEVPNSESFAFFGSSLYTGTLLLVSAVPQTRAPMGLSRMAPDPSRGRGGRWRHPLALFFLWWVVQDVELPLG